MSEIKNGRLRLYGAKHSKCNHMMTPGFKGLMLSKIRARTGQTDRQTDRRDQTHYQAAFMGDNCHFLSVVCLIYRA